ncbi:hypothetical protein [Kamptonema sp. UHCC 0994]|uniref:hypothetical protein n=1 Tax=Kamptonema sp. UHCC 0994 TaxID=3031329 RepID=UPI0023B9E001|nr:hypothetical protein [Kamptonema sp. UHCC 0994]MDF0554926.1 hypothetical protein [Kamptonema sp. UHCC 0994]
MKLPILPDINTITPEQYQKLSVEIVARMIKTLYPFPKNVVISEVKETETSIKISGEFRGREGEFDFEITKDKTTNKPAISYGLKNG